MTNDNTPSSSRADRVEVNGPCLLNPWGVSANLINMSLTGALLECKDFPEDLLLATKGELEISNMKLSGELIRVNKLRIGMEFLELTSENKSEIENFLNSLG